MRHGQTIHRCGLLLCVVPIEGVAISGQLVGHALFVVAFGIGHQVGPLITTRLPRSIVDVAVVPHDRLGVLGGHLSPNHETAIGQGRFLVVVSKVFEDEVGPGVVAPNVVGVIKKDVDPALIVLVPSAHVAA